MASGSARITVANYKFYRSGAGSGGSEGAGIRSGSAASAVLLGSLFTALVDEALIRHAEQDRDDPTCVLGC